MNDSTKLVMAVIVTAVVCIAGTYVLTSGSNGGSDATIIKCEGSTTLSPLMEKYAEIYEGYANVRIEIVSNGSQNGVDAANNGIADIGMSSRNVGHASHAGLLETKVGIDTVVLVVGSGTGVTSLTKAEVEGIYNGTITNWNMVGGNTLAISPLDRQSGSGTRTYFEESFNGVSATRSWPDLDQTGTVIGYVQSNPGAIGYVSLGSLTTAQQSMALALDMGSGSVSPIGDLPNYTLKRDLVLLTKDVPTGQVAMFIGWILGPEGQKILTDEGYLPLA